MEHKNMKWIYLFIITLLVAGCENNPYPSDGGLRVEPRKPDENIPPALSMIVADNYNYTEGVKKDFRIKVDVPAPGVPDVKIEGLPAGASFDPKTFVVSWIPGMFDGNKPDDPTIKSRVYPITIWLRSSLDEKEAIKETVNLTVYDSPLDLDISGNLVFSIREGKQASYEFEISNLDYPQGPYAVSIEGMPGNTKIRKITENKYALDLKVDHHQVKLNKTSGCSAWGEDCVEYTGKIIVFNPANHQAEKTVKVRVLDERLSTKLVANDVVEQGLDSTFQVSAYDLNGEVPPLIKLISAEPEYGEFSTVITKNEEAKSSVLNVRWKDIPPSYNGKTHHFKFEACSLSSKRTYNNCSQKSVKVKIKVKQRSAPIINRDEWKVGNIEYLNYDERRVYRIGVVDGDFFGEKVRNVVVKPKEMRKFVTWSLGKLYVQFDQPGIHQFSLVATSEYNMSSAESFVVEVFEPTRSRTVYFTDSTRDAEVKFFKQVMENVELMNPVLQPLNKRNLAGRENLVLGTGILLDPQMKDNIELAMGRIENVVVASPLIENMPTSFLDELQRDFHISILGRYSELPDTKPLKEMSFIAREDFEQAKDSVGLKQMTTPESGDPLIFSVGVDRVNCEDVLDLTDAKQEDRLKIGIICNRPQAGRYAILGTEFADLLTSKRDEKIAPQWLRRMLETKLSNKEEEK